MHSRCISMDFGSSEQLNQLNALTIYLEIFSAFFLSSCILKWWGNRLRLSVSNYPKAIHFVVALIENGFRRRSSCECKLLKSLYSNEMEVNILHCRCHDASAALAKVVNQLPPPPPHCTYSACLSVCLSLSPIFFCCHLVDAPSGLLVSLDLDSRNPRRGVMEGITTWGGGMHTVSVIWRNGHNNPPPPSHSSFFRGANVTGELSSLTPLALKEKWEKLLE